MRTFGRFVLCALVLAAIGCGSYEGRTMGTLSISVNDAVQEGRLFSVLPDDSLLADHYAIHGVGTSGQADGASFDLDISAAGGAADIDLLPGAWSLTAVVWNDDTPSIAVGSGAASTTIVIGVPASIVINCLPYDGSGTLNMHATWVPDVIASPSVEVEMVGWDSVSHTIPMTLASSVEANGTASLDDGWYVSFFRILDNGVLNAGIVRSVRMLANSTTHWSEYLTVNQLEGQVTLDPEWFPGLPLNLTTNPVEGEVNIYDGQTKTLAVTGADNDGGTSLVYAWYRNAAPIAIGTASSIVLDAADYEVGSMTYISCVVWQSNGQRAGDAQWTLLRGGEVPYQPVEGMTVDLATLHLDISPIEYGSVDVTVLPAGANNPAVVWTFAAPYAAEAMTLPDVADATWRAQSLGTQIWTCTSVDNPSVFITVTIVVTNEP